MIFLKKVKSKIRIFILRLQGAKIGKNCYVGNVSIVGAKYICIGNKVHIEDNVRLKANLIPKLLSNSKRSIFIEDNVFLGYSTVIDANVGVTIGENSMIGPMCFFTDSNHIHNLDDAPIFQLGGLYSPTIIKSNCWFGTHCIVLKGVTVDKNSVFAANSTVTKDTLKSSIYMGSPAKRYK